MTASTILGVWIFSGLIYQCTPMPPPNPDLRMTFSFDAAGEDILTYSRQGEIGFCRRKALYEFSDDRLKQKVTWVDPGNAEWCSQDTDMQMGNESITPAFVRNDQFYLQLQMGDQEITLLWNRDIRDKKSLSDPMK